MRYPWCDTYGNLIEEGDLVEDLDRLIIGYIEINSRGVPCIHTTMTYCRMYAWQPLDNKGPIEAYQKELFDETKSKFYWWRKHYVLSNITILKKGKCNGKVDL